MKKTPLTVKHEEVKKRGKSILARLNQSLKKE